jgi:hypothetical protein
MAKPKKAARSKSEAETTEMEVTRTSDVEKTPQGKVRRWLAELNLAHAREKNWRKEVEEIWDIYEAASAKGDTFCILWSNTEILAAAAYNSTPQPDVRRRFRDEDQVGKYVSRALERALSYEIDDYDFDAVMSDMVLDTLLAGRGVPRIKYEPKFSKVNPDGTVEAAPAAGEYVEPEEATEAAPDAESTEQAPADPNAPEAYEKISDQGVFCNHVQWDDYRQGPGKRWDDIPWLAYRHDFTFDMAEKAFGTAIAQALNYTQTENAEDATKDKDVRNVFKTCEVWEIWDKEELRVLFIAPSYAAQPCREESDPLNLRGFWPQPRPAYAIPNSRSTVPKPLYRMYKKQAKELEELSKRINKLIKALKVRGAYFSHLAELKTILEADDLEMLPVESGAEVAEMGGLDKALWIMPVDKIIAALQGAYQARNEIKQTIYEIIGIGDILRGASDPNETAKAQQIKSQWGSIRVQKLQREIQRVARDLMRLKAEVIAQQFTAEQLAKITNIKLPTPQEKDFASKTAAQAKQAGQQLPPEVEHMLGLPTWDDVVKVMQSDEMRSQRIDIETDSTVAETIDRDMTGMGEMLQALSGWIQQAFLAVQAGAMTIDTLKEIALSIVRRARLGSAVEDAFEQIKEPPPKPDQGQQLEQMKQGLLDLIKNEGTKLTQQEQGIEQRHQEIDGVVQQLGQTVQVASAHAMEAHQTAQVEKQATGELTGVLQQFAQTVQGVMQQMQSVQAALTAPKQIQFDRGPDKRVIGARSVTQNVTQQPTPMEAQLIQALGMVANTMQRLEQAITQPKHISFERDPETNRITGATASV